MIVEANIYNLQYVEVKAYGGMLLPFVTIDAKKLRTINLPVMVVHKYLVGTSSKNDRLLDDLSQPI